MLAVVAGILLTGGRSRRMGRDKASLRVGPGGKMLAVHLGELLASVAAPVLEVGPGRSGLPVPSAPDPCDGPLRAVGVAAHDLSCSGASGPALVVATDLPLLSAELLGAIASYGDSRSSVVPVVDGRPQLLCARWSPSALELAVVLVAEGERRVGAVFEAGDTEFVEAARLGSDVFSRQLSDVDDEAALLALGIEVPFGRVNSQRP